MTDEEHHRVGDSVAAWTLDACPPEDSPGIARHVAACPACSAEARRMRETAEWLAVGAETAPPAGLRDSVLSAARAARAPGTAVGPAEETLAGAYAVQIAAMDRLLGSLSRAHWRAAVPRHRSVRRMVDHLSGNDAMLAGDLGLAPAAAPPAGAPHERWRVQAQAVARHVSARTGLLDRPVRLAGPRPVRGPLRSAVVQRAFETWIHADDIRAAVDLPRHAPPPEHLKLIIGMGVTLLPAALSAAGRHHPGRTARLALTGPGGGEWSVPLAPGDDPGHPDVTVTAGAEDFCRLLANRREPAAFPHRAEGDPAVVADLLYGAATLGCD